MFGHRISAFKHKVVINQKNQGGIFVLAVASAFRLYWLITTQDYQGDSWRRILDMMTLVYHPIWPPGYFYLAKPFYVLFGHPELILRVFSFFCGTASVGIAYLIILDIFRQWEIALGAGLLLAIFPAHIAYSVLSLSEIPFFFFLLFSFLLLLRKKYGLSAVLLGVASFIRYESWPLVFIFPLFILLPSLFPQLSKFFDSIEKPEAVLRIAVHYFGISFFLPALYMGLNKISTGYYLWNFSEQNPNSTWDNIALTKVGSLSAFFSKATQILIKGYLNIPHNVQTSAGPMGYYIHVFYQENWGVMGMLGFVILLIFFGAGCVYGSLYGKYRFVILLLTSFFITGFILVGMARGSVMPYIRYSVLVLSFLVIIAGAGLGIVYLRKEFRIPVLVQALFLATLFCLQDFYTRYSGPDDPIRVANYVKSLVGPSTIAQRFDRVIGLTGPEQQTLILRKYLGMSAEKILSTSSLPQVGYISVGSEPLDQYRTNMIWALADLSYDEFTEYVIIPGQDFTLPASIPVIILAKDGLEDKNPETLTNIRQLLSKQYVMKFSSGALEVWVK